MFLALHSKGMVMKNGKNLSPHNFHGGGGKTRYLVKHLHMWIIVIFYIYKQWCMIHDISGPGRHFKELFYGICSPSCTEWAGLKCSNSMQDWPKSKKKKKKETHFQPHGAAGARYLIRSQLTKNHQELGVKDFSLLSPQKNHLSSWREEPITISPVPW